MNKSTLMLFLLFCANIFAQNKTQTKSSIYPTQERGKCLSYEYEILLQQKYPAQFGTKESFEENLSRVIEERQATAHLRMGEIRVMPIIFHVIHGAGTNVGTAENISQAQIQSQVDVLNEDFRRITGTPGFNNDPVGADTEIQFCLATVDQYGNCLAEPGIMRWDDWGAGPFPALPNNGPDPIQDDIKPCTIQDPERFLNYWVIDMEGGTLGYAQFPELSELDGLSMSGGAANTDGVVIGPTFTGRVGNLSAPYDEGRTATHEIGHWLGLRHIWGDGDCTVDDFCADTPNSDASNGGCPTHVSCGTTDMVENYMDYTNDACMNIFTIDQKARIDAVLAMSSRRPYSSSAVDPPAIADAPVECNPNPLPAAAFQINGETLNARNNCDANAFDALVFCRDTETPTITITDESTSCGSTITSWAWDFGDGNTSTSQNPIHTYLTDGIFNIMLSVTDANGTSTRTATTAVVVLSGASCTTPVCSINASSDTNLPITITTSRSEIISYLTTTNLGVITDVNVVNLTGNHSYFSDLTFILTSEDGTSIELLSNECGNQDVNSFTFNFDDSAASGTLNCSANINANLQPNGSLLDFNGLPAAGVWTLRVIDSFNNDGGAITGWGLEICTLIPTCSATITAIAATEDVCTGTTMADFSTAEASVTYSSGSASDFTLEWFDDAAFTTAVTNLPTATNCTRATKTYYLRATCIADNTVQNGGNLTVTVYPTPQAPTIADDTNNCSITITPNCDNSTDVPDVLSFAGPLDYSGEAANALDVTGATVTNGAGVCTAATYNVTHGSCLPTCSATITAIAATEDVCTGTTMADFS
ncbi:MAG: PKD domain-containing protein, partial [Chitinophagales bacterium]